MKIKSIEVKNLNQRMTGKITFFDDLNILTDANGSGKTTLLKACWYLVSGNIEKVFQEIEFEEIFIQTDQAKLFLACRQTSSEEVNYEVELVHFEELSFSIEGFLGATDRRLTGKWDEIKGDIWKFGLAMSFAHNSLFFPTFRRVEGGFAVGPKLRTLSDIRKAQNAETEDDQLTKALLATSAKLTRFQNKFVCSVSTTDVEALVAETAANMTAAQKEKYEALAQRISTQILEWQGSGSSTDESADRLTQILKDVTDTEAQRNRITEPNQLLGEQIKQFFKGRKITIGKSTFGEGLVETAAASLSAGEKQMISFLCYAGFYKNNLFMVDEPELSLHLDWQRKFVGALRALGPSNQFFFVTHSPAIYAKFSDSEIAIDETLITNSRE